MAMYEQRVNFLIATILLATNMHLLKADYVLKIQVEQYFNLQHNRDDGFCCEIADNCEDDCDNRFLFCLQTHNVPIGSEMCPLGNYSTGNISGDSMVFNVGQDLEEGVPNPLVFTGPRWPGSVQLHVRVDDIDPTTGMDAGDDLVTQFNIDLVNLSVSTAFIEGNYIGGNDIGLLRLSFRVTCTDNFYGSDCATFCVERDDELGHYTCDSEGNIVCREGFQNPSTNCTECILAEGCSPVGGYCSDSDSCICNVGYTGDNCTIDLDPCGHNTLCENGATCNNTGPDQYKCLCAAGFEGDSCERETNECDPNPCMNGGNCQDLQADYICICIDTFSGRNCGNQESPGSGIGPVVGGAMAAVLLLAVIVVLIVMLIAVLRRKRTATRTNLAVTDKGSTPKGFKIENPTYGADDAHVQSTNTNSYATISSTNKSGHHSTYAIPGDSRQEEFAEQEFPSQDVVASESAYYSTVPVEEETATSNPMASEVYYSTVPVEGLQEAPVSSSSTMEPGADGLRYEYVRMGSTASISTSLSQHDSAEGMSVTKQKGSLSYHAGSDDGGSTEDPAVHFYDYPILKKKPHAHLQPYEYESPGSTAREHQFPIEDVNPSAHYEFDNKY